jgi:hypothetical protein
MAYEDQRDAREADVAGGDRRTSKRAEGSADPRDEPVDGFLRSKGVRFLEAAKVAWPPTSVGQDARAPAYPLARGGLPRAGRWAPRPPGPLAIAGKPPMNPRGSRRRASPADAGQLQPPASRPCDAEPTPSSAPPLRLLVLPPDVLAVAACERQRGSARRRCSDRPDSATSSRMAGCGRGGSPPRGSGCRSRGTYGESSSDSLIGGRTASSQTEREK